MKQFSYFFIDRPRFATVVSLVIILIGVISYSRLPISQFPEVAPPTVVVRAAYPGATPDIIARTIGAPIEQEVNGVEGMLYMNSQGTTDGAYQLTIAFELGTDLDSAQVLVQNRLSAAAARLPEPVRRIGITVQKSTPDLLMVVQMFSDDNSLDMLYISNYALLNVRDPLKRLDGIGDVRLFGGREYSMRIWLDPERLSLYQMSTDQVIAALREQNQQIAAGVIGQNPVTNQAPFQLNVTTQGRLESAEEFEEIVVKRGPNGERIFLRDIGRIELGALDYSVNAYLNEKRTLAIPLFQRPGSNALATADEVRATMEELSASFPKGITYDIVYDPTRFIDASIDAVFETLLQAMALVVLVMLIFLQSWRAAIIPVLAIPVSLIGTFAVMLALGFSINNLTLFGLVLAIGIVVDDAIVVVENIERNLAKGMSGREAARHSMKEVSGALVATTLVLLAVFVPTAMIDGISGEFYQQFALTLSVSTVFSTLVSLTLSPALGRILLRDKASRPDPLTRLIDFFFGWFLGLFNAIFDKATGVYGWTVKKVLRLAVVMVLLYGGLLALAWEGFQKVPSGFIPEQDQGYAIVAGQLPTGASLERTDAAVQQLIAEIKKIDGIRGAVGFAGFNGATFSNATNSYVIFPVFAPFSERTTEETSKLNLMKKLQQVTGTVDAFSVVLPPPSVRGLGIGGGFKMEIQDRAQVGYPALEQATWGLAFAAMADPMVSQAFTPYTAASPQLYLDIDREKAITLGINLQDAFSTLETHLGSTFVNELNLYGRTFRVTAQADSTFRDEASDILQLKVPNSSGQMVPLGSFVSLGQSTGPDRVVRHNLYSSADLLGTPADGVSTGQVLARMEQLADQVLPPGVGYEWTEMAYQETTVSGSPMLIFTFAVVLVFLVLAAQYESWKLPLAVVLTVPLCLAGAIWGVHYRGMDNNVLTQIGLVVLVALASKNAILIVEFANQLEEEGKSPFDAALEAAKLRLRPIMMTAFSFILGVIPLVIAVGPGAEMRKALGTVVFFGMIAVTFFGLFFAPLFYRLIRGKQKNKATLASEKV